MDGTSLLRKHMYTPQPSCVLVTVSSLASCHMTCRNQLDSRSYRAGVLIDNECLVVREENHSKLILQHAVVAADSLLRSETMTHKLETDSVKTSSARGLSK